MTVPAGLSEKARERFMAYVNKRAAENDLNGVWSQQRIHVAVNYLSSAGVAEKGIGSGIAPTSDVTAGFNESQLAELQTAYRVAEDGTTLLHLQKLGKQELWQPVLPAETLPDILAAFCALHAIRAGDTLYNKITSGLETPVLCGKADQQPDAAAEQQVVYKGAGGITRGVCYQYMTLSHSLARRWADAVGRLCCQVMCGIANAGTPQPYWSEEDWHK